MKRKLGLIVTVFSCLALVGLQAQTRSGKPNIILIVADDLGYGDLSLNGSMQIQTPHIDRLAQEGINVSQGYVSAPVCSPSRAGLMTGRNQVSFGHDNNIGGSQTGFDPAYLGLPVTEITVAERLKKLGYVTGLIGKWHLGTTSQFHPLNRGFDEFWGYLAGGHSYFPGENNQIECNYKTPQTLTYITDDKGDECIDFIKRHKEQPFFLFASFNAPHTPMQATKADLELFKHIQDEKRRIYCAMVHRLDVNVGRIVKAVEEQKLADNTLFVFMSDNGGPCYSNSSVNAPFRGQKGTLLEGGIHVPFIMKWEGVLPKGLIYNDPVISLDLTPTFVKAAGGDVTGGDKMDGVNLLPFLRGVQSGKPHDSMFWRFTISASIRDGNWKLVRLPDRLPMLFDLSVDTAEQHNVALENRKRTQDMLKRLGNWDVKQPHPLFLEGAGWKMIQLGFYDKHYYLEQPD
jgi:arylsulfatase A-like enzyme